MLRRKSVYRIVFVIVVAAIAAAVIGPFAAPLRVKWQQSIYDKKLGVRDVVAAADALRYRQSAARLTAGFAYRPQRVTRGSSGPDPSELPLYASVSALTGNPATLHGSGIAYLAVGRDHDAGAAFEKAVRRAYPQASLGAAIGRVSDAPLLSDLAAAYYQQGIRENRTESILNAIDLSSRALEIDPQLQAAAFNRALAIEQLHTPVQAIDAWNRYLSLDGDSGWASEARSHIATLSAAPRPKEQTTEQRAKRIEYELLPAWADAFVRGDTVAADAQLREATDEARGLVSCCGDAFHQSAVEVVEKAVKSDRRRALQLAAAHQKYREGRDLYVNDSNTEAIAVLEAARDGFLAAQDVFAVKAWDTAAASYIYIGNPQTAVRESTAALDFCTARDDCSDAQRGHLLWGRALAAGRLGDPQAAIADYTEALHAFEAAREMENAASVHALIAENLTYLGAVDDAWPHLLVALRAANANGKLSRIYIAFTDASDAAKSHKHFISARLFEDVVIDVARRENNTILLSDSLLTRGRLLAAMESADAHRDLEEASKLALSVKDPQRRARVLAAAAMAQADVLPPNEAQRSLTEALKYYEATGDHYHIAELHAARAEAEEKLGLTELAEKDFLDCIRQLELERTTIATSELRTESFSRSSSVFDRVIRHLWAAGRRDDAFSLAEQSRGRELGGVGTAAPVRIAGVMNGIRDEDALIEYALLPDRMVVWVIRRNGAIFVERPLPASEVEDAVVALRDDFIAAIPRLGVMTYAPIANAVKDSKRLVIVANKALTAIPFSALRDPSTRRYLIEDHEIVVAPSAAAYLQAIQRDRSLRDRARSVLVAAYVDGDESRHLPRLDAGSNEIQAIRRVYGETESLSDSAASPERLLAAARNAGVVHIVAHAVSNGDHPEYASIVLAPGAEGRDLYASTVARASLRFTRLLFLNSCGTPARTVYNDAPLTLPESFVAAGVPLVIGSLTPLDDADAADFAVSFHRAFARSGDAVDALRQTQLECLRSASRRDPQIWSAWIAIGGSS